MTGLLSVAGSTASEGFELKSCRFDAPSTTKLTRTPTVAGNRRTWTISCWFKWSVQTQTYTQFFDGGGASTSECTFYLYGADGSLQWSYWNGSSEPYKLRTNQVFRDPSAWYHFVAVQDTTQATASDRLKIYLNGEQITSFSAANYPTQNLECPVNNTYEHAIGSWQGGAGRYYSGYLAEFYLIDGSALTPSSFGETNEDTNQWQPIDPTDIEPTVTFGTNGFYLDFKDSADLGNDSSGNGNDFTPTNLTANDMMLDSPMNNFCTFNSVGRIGGYTSSTPDNTNLTFTEGNLSGSGSGGAKSSCTFPITSGKWYWEARISGGGNGNLGMYGSGNQRNSDTDTVTDGNIYGLYFDADVGTSWYESSDGTTYNSHSMNSIQAPWTPWHQSYGTTCIFNFGQDSSFAGNETAQGNQDGNNKGDFYYSVPAGYLALCSDNLADPSIALPTEHYNTVAYSGDGTTPRTLNAGFQPDFTWLKIRTVGWSNRLFDSIRGANLALYSNANAAEAAGTSGYLSGFASTGPTFTGNGADVQDVNESGDTYVTWNWKGGGTAVSNTDGSITSSVSANPTAGFSIVGYTGTGANATVGHGLSQAPEFIIQKNRDETQPWWCYSKTIGAGGQISLDEANAQATDGAVLWNSTAPTSSVFSLGNNTGANGNLDECIVYCFHSVDGYCKVGSYTANGNADGAFIYTGFRPAFLLVKNIDSSSTNWHMYDNKRLGYNVDNNSQRPNLATVDQTDDDLDITSNGIKFRRVTSALNTSGDRYLYIAIAETPFKTSNAR